jgi:hypothetical protein
MFRMLMTAAAVVVMLAGPGCTPRSFDATRATRDYPAELHQPKSVDIQVFRRNTEIELVNATAHSYRDFDLWLNQRFTRRVAELPAGRSITLSLWDFFDVRGEVFRAGGFFRTEEPTQLRMVQIEPGNGEPLVGLITIREDD